MKLYGTTTSPFVRRLQVVATEIGEPVERVDTATDAGMEQLRQVSPIRKVPVAIVDGRTLFDSRVIIDWLTTTRGFGGLTPPSDRWRERNLVNAIDAALDAVIQLFYLKRDGVAIDGTPYAVRQLDRTAAIFTWLGTQLAPDHKTFGSPQDAPGLAEISLVCALDWMDFRQTYPTDTVGEVATVRSAWAARPSLLASRPHG